MKVVAFNRTQQGTGASRRLRNAGQTPGIIYGGADAPQLIALDGNALWHALKKEAFHGSILDLEIDGKAQQVLLRDFQMHAYKQLVLHADFQRVDAAKDQVTGERLGQAGWRSPSKTKPQGRVAEAEFTSSSGDVRASSVNAKKGLSGEERLETAPNRVK
jgi:ribosomal protein L25 (general stress protein Ctc)